jgi:hypothetical protein
MIFPARGWLLVRFALACSLTLLPSLFDLRGSIECLLIFIALQYSLCCAAEGTTGRQM